MPDDAELPLRFYRSADAGYVLRCRCGAELAAVRRGVTTMQRLRAAVELPSIVTDLTPGGILLMITHAERCDKWPKQ